MEFYLSFWTFKAAPEQFQHNSVPSAGNTGHLPGRAVSSGEGEGEGETALLSSGASVVILSDNTCTLLFKHNNGMKYHQETGTLVAALLSLWRLGIVGGADRFIRFIGLVSDQN